jgi:PEP-CTERM motif
MFLTKLLRTAAIAAGLALISAAAPASAAVIYNFSGTCDFGCTGTATATLILDDTYTPGTAIAGISQLISFTYYGTGVVPVFTINPTPSFMGGELPVASGAPTDPFIISDGLTNQFAVGTSGDWIWLGNEGGDSVTDGTFTLTPEPSSFVLIGGGVAALAALRRRKR